MLSPKLLNVSTPNTFMELSSGLAHASMAVPDVQGCQKQCMSNDAVADCGRAKNRRVSDFSVKAASVSGASVAAAEKKRHSCEICSRTYANLRNLTQHKKIHHAEGFRDLCACNECGKTFISPMTLFHHRSKFHDENKQGKECVYDQWSQWSQCSQCSQIFPDPGALRQHISSDHTKKKKCRFVCPICEQAVHSQGALTKHLFTQHNVNHSKTEPVACGLCGKEFLYKSNLVHHMASHGGEKPYTCQKCSRNFSGLRSLERHDRYTHNNDYPYDCELCSHPGFSGLQQFRQHIQSKHPSSLPKDFSGDSGGGKPERNPGLFNRAQGGCIEEDVATESENGSENCQKERSSADCTAQLVTGGPAGRSFAPGGEQYPAQMELGGQLQETDQPHRQSKTRSPRKNARPQKRCTALNQAYSRDII